jgi:hypothetical protein
MKTSTRLFILKEKLLKPSNLIFFIPVCLIFCIIAVSIITGYILIVMSLLLSQRRSFIIPFDINNLNSTYDLSNVLKHDKNDTITILNFGPRVPDTTGNLKTREYLISKLKYNNFNVNFFISNSLDYT